MWYDQQVDTRLVLLEAGAKPLQTLSYQFRPDQSANVTLDMKVTQRKQANGAALEESVLPTMRVTTRYEAVGLTPEGNLRYNFHVTEARAIQEPGLEPEVYGSAMESLNTFRVLAGYGVVTPQGVYRKVSFTTEAAEDGETARHAISQWAVQFPQEPIGSGARWEVHQSADEGQTGRVVTYTLNEVSRSGVKLEFMNHQEKPQEPTLRNAPESLATGMLEIDLGSMTYTSDMRRTQVSQAMMMHEGEPLAVKSVVQTRVKVRPQVP